MTREEAGDVIRGSESKISRLELGRVSFKERDVSDLLDLYGISDDEQRSVLLNLAREANTPGWWHQYSDLLPHWFQPLLGLEEAAAIVRTYEVQFIPGLLQTEDYARAVTTQGYASAGREEIERRVQLRMARQHVLNRPNPPRLWAVLDEAAVRRMIGGPDVMRAQIEYLIQAAKWSNITLQVMPFRFGGHAAEGGPFHLLRFPEQDLSDVVYVEQLTGALYLEKREDLDRYMMAMERLSVESEVPEATPDVLRGILDELP